MSAVDHVLAALDAGDCLPKPCGQDRWQALCPAHDDRSPSLSVARKDDRLLVHCHAGCRTADVLQALGLEMGDLYEPSDSGSNCVATTYRDRASWQPKRRFDPLPTVEQLDAFERRLHKDARLLARARDVKGWTSGALAALGIGWGYAGWRSTDRCERFTIPVFDAHARLVNVCGYLPGADRKLLALAGRPRDLFPAPELLCGETVHTALGPRPLTEHEPVYLVEGEPDALSGCSLGVLAVSVPGANGWRTEWAVRFAGMTVRVLVDHDDPGRKLSGRLTADLSGHSASVRAMDWTEVAGRPVPAGYDLGDWAVEQREQAAA